MVKVVKKRTKLFNRFESDRHHRVGVFFINIREAGENQEVLIAESEEDSEVLQECQQSDMDQIEKQGTYILRQKEES